MPFRLRPAFVALWQLDLAFADVVATSSQPALGAIRLAWWRERLDELDSGRSRSEPRLQAVERELLPRGTTGHELTKLEDAWTPLLAPFPWGDDQADGLMLRGKILFGVGTRLLGCASGEAELAGAIWSLIDGAQHCSDAVSGEFLMSRARGIDPRRGVPPKLRALTVLTALAIANVREPSSGLARGMAAMRHRLTGKFVRL